VVLVRKGKKTAAGVDAPGRPRDVTAFAEPRLDLIECPTCRKGGVRPARGELRCSSCRDRFPIAGGIVEFQRTFDEYSENYDRICADDLEVPKTPSIVKRIFAELVLERAEGVVCDLGCGDGYVIRRVRAKYRIAVDIARSYLETLPRSILRLWARVETVPLRTAAADTVVCTDVIEHVVDAAALAGEIDRLCKEDGSVLLGFPFEQDLSVYDLPEYKAKYGKYRFVHLRSIDDELIGRLFPSFEVRAERLITEGMALMEFKPFPIKFIELRRKL
jgi:SAM-dependent methyltransferase